MYEPESEPVAVGWTAFSEHLRGIGIAISPDALETRRRRHGLPPRESVRGRLLRFSPGDLQRWVLHLTGVQLDLWLTQHRRDRNARRVVLAPRGRGPQLSSRGLWLPRRYFAVTLRRHGGLEQVVRGAGGYTYCSLTDTEFESRVLQLDLARLGPFQPGFWRYDYARIATRADLHEPRYEHRRPRDQETRPAKTLLVALARVEGTWRHVLVPGDWFGARIETKTRFVMSPRQPGFAELCRRVMQLVPRAQLVAFGRRVEIDPVTLDPMARGKSPEGADLLREPPTT
jgi:hypothetical protein